MNSKYIKALDIIWKAKVDLKRIYEEATTKTMEEKSAYKAIERLLEELENAQGTIEHFSKPVKEGVLMENPQSGKFYIEFNDGSTSWDFSCGNLIEIYLKEDAENDIEQGWYAGRIEHNGKGYYFYGPGRPMLYRGMRTRIRE